MLAHACEKVCGVMYLCVTEGTKCCGYGLCEASTLRRIEEIVIHLLSVCVCSDCMFVSSCIYDC